MYSFLQITPAHDPNDFEVGKRHNLEFINIFTDDGLINSNGGKPYTGMKRFDVRVAVVKDLEAKVLKKRISSVAESHPSYQIFLRVYLFFFL